MSEEKKKKHDKHGHDKKDKDTSKKKFHYSGSGWSKVFLEGLSADHVAEDVGEIFEAIIRASAPRTPEELTAEAARAAAESAGRPCGCANPDENEGNALSDNPDSRSEK